MCYLIKKKTFTTFNKYEIEMDNFLLYNLQPQIRKSWDSMENANKKKESSDF